MSDDRWLGDLLVREKVITAEQWTKAQSYQASIGGSLRDIIVKFGFAKPAVIDAIVAKEAHMETADVRVEDVHRPAMARLSRDLLERRQIFPLRHPHGAESLRLAMGDPDDFSAVQEIQFLTNCRVEPVLAARASIKKAINQYYNQTAVPAGPLSEAQARALQEAPERAVLLALVEAMVDKKLLSADDVIGRLRKEKEPARKA